MIMHYKSWADFEIALTSKIFPMLDKRSINHYISRSPGLVVLYKPTDKTRHLSVVDLRYKNVSMGEIRYFEDDGTVEFHFVNKLVVDKKLCSKYFRWNRVAKSDDDADLVAKYVYPIHKSSIGIKYVDNDVCTLQYENDDYQWNKVYNTLDVVLDRMVAYYDRELEPDPSKVHGWNLMCRIRAWHKTVKRNMTDYDCICNLQYDQYEELYQGKEFDLHNGSVAVMRRLLDKNEKYANFVVVTRDKKSAIQAFVVPTYKGSIFRPIAHIGTAEAYVLRSLISVEAP